MLQAGPFAWTSGNHWPLPFHQELASNVEQNFAGIRKSHPKVNAVFVGNPRHFQQDHWGNIFNDP